MPAVAMLDSETSFDETCRARADELDLSRLEIDRLSGLPFESLADWAAQRKAEEAAAKVVQFAEWRARLRPATATPER
jgi:hypothetical protein